MEGSDATIVVIPSVLEDGLQSELNERSSLMGNASSPSRYSGEKQNLLKSIPASTKEENHIVKTFRNITAITILTLIAVATVIFVNSSRNGIVGDEVETGGSDDYYVPSDDNSGEEGSDVELFTNSLNFTLNREEYAPLSTFIDNSTFTQVMRYKILDGFVAVVEPSAPMELYLLEDYSSDLLYKYTVCKYDAVEDVISYECRSAIMGKSTVSIDCTPYDQFYILVKEYDGSNLLRSSSGYGLCLYVRRSIYDLTTSDLSTTMDAMYKVWELSESDGQALYGENFHASVWFTSAHMFNAAQRDSDHIHEGQGFLTQHLKITNYYEAAFQAVDPSTSLMYWDYTAEADDSLQDSLMFTEDTFGSISIAGEGACCWTYANNSILDGVIPDGRWAYLKADVNTQYPDLDNGYGYMRGAWNTNPSPYVSRYAIEISALPSCSAFYSWLEESTQKDFFDIAPFAPHAATHGAIGGVFGCDVFDPLLEAGLLKDFSSQKHVCKKWSILLKEMYRSDMISARTDCSSSTDTFGINDMDCGYVCSDQDASTMAATMKGLITLEYVPDSHSDSIWDDWVDFVCNGDAHKVFSGDHLEAASPSDPSFWPIHPNLERLFQAKLLAAGFSDSTWPSEASDVCDKHTCYEEKYGAKDEYAECCYGHFENDQLLDFTTGDTSSGYGLTNAEMMVAANPASEEYSMPYIYDDFSWSHCDEDFPSLLLSYSSRR